MRCTHDYEFEEEDSSWANDRVDRVGQGINTKVNNFRSSGNNSTRGCYQNLKCFPYSQPDLKSTHLISRTM